MIREAVWRDHEGKDYSELSSYELMVQERQKDIFLDLLNYIQYLCEEEDKLRLQADHQGQKDLFDSIFGNYLSASGQLLEGVKCSLRYSGIIYHADVSSKLRHVEKKISQLNNMKSAVSGKSSQS